MRIRRGFISLLLVLASAFVACEMIGLASDDPMVVVFFREGCPECLRLEKLLGNLESQYATLAVARYEINVPGAMDLVWDLCSAYGVLPTTFPMIFVGNAAIAGMTRVNELRVRSAIENCILSGCPSPVSHLEKMGIPWWRIFAIGVVVALILAYLLL